MKHENLAEKSFIVVLMGLHFPIWVHSLAKLKWHTCCKYGYKWNIHEPCKFIHKNSHKYVHHFYRRIIITPLNITFHLSSHFTFYIGRYLLHTAVGATDMLTTDSCCHMTMFIRFVVFMLLLYLMVVIIDCCLLNAGEIHMCRLCQLW